MTENLLREIFQSLQTSAEKNCVYLGYDTQNLIEKIGFQGLYRNNICFYGKIKVITSLYMSLNQHYCKVTGVISKINNVSMTEVNHLTN